MVITTRPGSRTRVAGIIRFMVLLGPGRHGGRNVVYVSLGSWNLGYVGRGSQGLSPMEHRTEVLLLSTTSGCDTFLVSRNFSPFSFSAAGSLFFFGILSSFGLVGYHWSGSNHRNDGEKRSKLNKSQEGEEKTIVLYKVLESREQK
jgi:hypothetical protein